MAIYDPNSTQHSSNIVASYKPTQRYFETEYTKRWEVVLKKKTPLGVKTYCEGYQKKDKRRRMKAFDGFYFNEELKRVY